MFIGHFGVGFAGKKFAPKISLGTLFLSAQFVDLIWPIFLLAGVERVQIEPGNTVITPLDFVHYPISHSLLMGVVWSLVIGGTYFLIRRYRKGAIVAGVLVVSHWFLDLIVHSPDLPLTPFAEVKYGLEGWNSVPLTLIAEGAFFFGGLILYLKSTRAKDKTGIISLWAFVIVLLGIYAGNLLGPPPPSVDALKWVALGVWLFVPWGYWIDRHRVALHH